MPDFSYYIPVKFFQVLPVFDQTGLRKKQVLCSFSQVPDSFARRQDLKKEEAARSVWLPPLLRQIYYIFQRKANAAFPILTFARRARLRRPPGTALTEHSPVCLGPRPLDCPIIGLAIGHDWGLYASTGLLLSPCLSRHSSEKRGFSA